MWDGLLYPQCTKQKESDIPFVAKEGQMLSRQGAPVHTPAQRL